MSNVSYAVKCNACRVCGEMPEVTSAWTGRSLAGEYKHFTFRFRCHGETKDLRVERWILENDREGALRVVHHFATQPFRDSKRKLYHFESRHDDASLVADIVALSEEAAQDAFVEMAEKQGSSVLHSGAVEQIQRRRNVCVVRWSSQAIFPAISLADIRGKATP